MKILTLSTVLFLVRISTFAQSDRAYLLAKSADIFVLDSSNYITNIYSGPRILTYKNRWGKKGKVETDSIWGYINNKGETYRIYKHLYYKLIDSLPIIKYSLSRAVRFGRVYVPKEFFYYSKDLDSPITSETK